MDSIYWYFLIVILSSLTELYFKVKWIDSYFYNPLKFPILRMDIERNQIEKLSTLVEFEYKKRPNPKIIFKRLKPDIIGFREKTFYFAINYPEVMHGCLLIDKTKNKITAYGLLNYTVIIIVSLIAYEIFDGSNPFNIILITIIPILVVTALVYAQRTFYVKAINSLIKQ